MTTLRELASGKVVRALDSAIHKECYDSFDINFENYQREMKTITTRFKKVIDRQSSTVRNITFHPFSDSLMITYSWWRINFSLALAEYWSTIFWLSPIQKCPSPFSIMSPSTWSQKRSAANHSKNWRNKVWTILYHSLSSANTTLVLSEYL